MRDDNSTFSAGRHELADDRQQGGLCRSLRSALGGEAVHAGVCKGADYGGLTRVRPRKSGTTQIARRRTTRTADIPAWTRERVFYTLLLRVPHGLEFKTTISA